MFDSSPKPKRQQEPAEQQPSTSKTSLEHVRKHPSEKAKHTFTSVKSRRLAGLAAIAAARERPSTSGSNHGPFKRGPSGLPGPGTAQRRPPILSDEAKIPKGAVGRYQMKRCKTGDVDYTENLHSLVSSDNGPQIETQGRELRTLGPRSIAVVPDPDGTLVKASYIPFGRHSGRRTDGYGSLPSTGSTDRGVIYCVHGKPSGCCLVSQAEVVESNPIPIPINEHCHRQKSTPAINSKARNQLLIATVLCLLFMIAEIVGGVLSGSLAIATDAAHLLTDLTSFCISLFSIWVAQRPSTRTMNFGWYRAEVIGALTSVLLIWVVTGILVYMAVNRIIEPDFQIDSTIMLISASLGVAVNLVMGIALHPAHNHSHGGSGHGHDHGHKHSKASKTEIPAKASSPELAEKGAVPVDTLVSSQTTIVTSHQQRPQANINVRAAFVHVVGDLLQSIGVVIAALFIYFEPTWIIVDPICTFVFSILVLVTTCTIIKDTIVVLMEGMPRDVDFNAVLQTFMNIDGVVRVHNLRIWALSLEKTALSAHLAIRAGVNPTQVLKTATRNIHTNFNFFEMTLQIEEFHANMEDCTECNDTKNS